MGCGGRRRRPSEGAAMPGNEVLATDTGDWTADVTGSSGELANEDTEPSGTALDRRQ